MAGHENILRGLLKRMMFAEGGNGADDFKDPKGGRGDRAGDSKLGSDNVPDVGPTDRRGGHTDEKELKKD